MEWCFPTTGDQTTLQPYDNLTTYVCLVSCVQVTESITSRQDIYKGRAAEVDMVTLVAAILITLPRRDMSLNRRLFTWLLGTEINPSSPYPDCHPLASKEGFYFTNYSSDLLIKALHHTSAALTAADPADTCGRKQELIKTVNQLETSYVRGPVPHLHWFHGGWGGGGYFPGRASHRPRTQHPGPSTG